MPAGKGRISVFAGHRASPLSWIGRRRTGRPVGSGPTFHAYSPSPRQRTGWCCPTIADRTDALPRVIGPVGIAGTASRSRTRRARRAGDIPGRYPGRYPGPRQGAEGGCVASKGAAPKLTIRTSLRASARVLGQPGIFSRQHPGDPWQPGASRSGRSTERSFGPRHDLNAAYRETAPICGSAQRMRVTPTDRVFWRGGEAVAVGLPPPGISSGGSYRTVRG
jgi:hypothetical protein